MNNYIELVFEAAGDDFTLSNFSLKEAETRPENIINDFYFFFHGEKVERFPNRITIVLRKEDAIKDVKIDGLKDEEAEKVLEAAYEQAVFDTIGDSPFRDHILNKTDLLAREVYSKIYYVPYSEDIYLKLSDRSMFKSIRYDEEKDDIVIEDFDEAFYQNQAKSQNKNWCNNYLENYYVTYNGKKFNANQTAINNINNLLSSVENKSVHYRLFDNTFAELDETDLLTVKQMIEKFIQSVYETKWEREAKIKEEVKDYASYKAFIAESYPQYTGLIQADNDPCE